MNIEMSQQLESYYDDIASNEERIIKRSDVAMILGIDLRAVDKLAKEGILRRIVLPTHKNAIGFLKSEVMKVIRQ